MVPDLAANQKITLYGRIPETFLISHIIATGASVRCYFCETPYGVLKEYLPSNSPSIMRQDNGHLVHNPGMEEEKKTFIENMDKYVEQCKGVISSFKKYPDLRSFIPDIEFYYSSPKEDDTDRTVYMFTGGPPAQTFEDLRKIIRESPDTNPEEKLLNILISIQSLTKCICSIHEAGLYHRDIKPSNFGFGNLGGEISYEKISIFDVNTICDIKSNQEDGLVGTRGFTAPELKNTKATIKTDIYSIGATLFCAIVITDETAKNDYRYDDRFFDDIEKLVNKSALIVAAKRNIMESSIKKIVEILQNTLCSRKQRYDCCENLIKDLKEAIRSVRRVVDKMQIENSANMTDVEDDIKDLLNDDEIRKIDELLDAEQKMGKKAERIKLSNAYILGIAYYCGHKVDFDKDKALHYLKLCADDPEFYTAKYLCAKLNDRGRYFFDMNYKDIISKHCSRAMYDQAKEMCTGNNFERIRKKGKKLMLKAAEFGSHNAMLFVAESYIAGNKSESKVKFGVEISDREREKYQVKVMKYILKCMSRESLRAKKLFAQMYQEGYFVEKDIHEAIKKYNDLLDEKYEGVYFNLYDCYNAINETDKANMILKKIKEMPSQQNQNGLI